MLFRVIVFAAIIIVIPAGNPPKYFVRRAPRPPYTPGNGSLELPCAIYKSRGTVPLIPIWAKSNASGCVEWIASNDEKYEFRCERQAFEYKDILVIKNLQPSDITDYICFVRIPEKTRLERLQFAVSNGYEAENNLMARDWNYTYHSHRNMNFNTPFVISDTNEISLDLPSISEIWLGVNEPIELTCGFHLNDFFDNGMYVLIWRQHKSNGEIKNIYSKPDKYSFRSHRGDNEYREILTIQNLQPSDPDVYSCNVKGSSEHLLFKIAGFTDDRKKEWHFVNISKPVYEPPNKLAGYTTPTPGETAIEESKRRDIIPDNPNYLVPPVTLGPYRGKGDFLELTCSVNHIDRPLSSLSRPKWWVYDDNGNRQWIESNGQKYEFRSEYEESQFKDILVITHLQPSDIRSYFCAFETTPTRRGEHLEFIVKRAPHTESAGSFLISLDSVMHTTDSKEPLSAEKNPRPSAISLELPSTNETWTPGDKPIKLTCSFHQEDIFHKSSPILIWEHYNKDREIERVLTKPGKYSFESVRSSNQYKEILTIDHLQSSEPHVYFCYVANVFSKQLRFQINSTTTEYGALWHIVSVSQKTYSKSI